jgi:hypothetical protein
MDDGPIGDDLIAADYTKGAKRGGLRNFKAKDAGAQRCDHETHERHEKNDRL